jgi:hypothetical protein
VTVIADKGREIRIHGNEGSSNFKWYRRDFVINFNSIQGIFSNPNRAIFGPFRRPNGVPTQKGLKRVAQTPDSSRLAGLQNPERPKAADSKTF